MGGGWSIGGAGCFAADTLVTLADGTTKPVQLLAQGERLRAAAGGRSDAIAQVMTLRSDHLRQLSFRVRGSDSNEEQHLRLTHDHRVWVDGRGWVFAVDLKAGDWLHGVDGQMREVTANERLPGQHEVYGVQMDSDNVLYAAGILAEDQCFKAAPAFRASPQTGVAQ